MSNQDDAPNGLKLTDWATLNLLSALEEGPHPTQRGLAKRIGVALGMTNSVLKRAVRKGMIKVKDAPTKRYAYYVTPKGFGEKSRLVAEFLSSSLTFFRKARREYSGLCSETAMRGHKRVALCGVGELAEIAMLSVMESELDLCGVIEPGSNQSHFSGVSVYATAETALADSVDAVLITSTTDPQAVYDEMVKHFGAERVFAAPLLHVRKADVKGGAKS